VRLLLDTNAYVAWRRGHDEVARVIRDAERLYVSFNTVHSHTKAVYRKLGVSSRREAVEHASEITLL
jgi:hypothetical protein